MLASNNCFLLIGFVCFGLGVTYPIFERMQVCSRKQKALKFEGRKGFLFLLVWQSFSWLEGNLRMPLLLAPAPWAGLLGGTESRKSSKVWSLVAVLHRLGLLGCKDGDWLSDGWGTSLRGKENAACKTATHKRIEMSSVQFLCSEV